MVVERPPFSCGISGCTWIFFLTNGISTNLIFIVSCSSISVITCFLCFGFCITSLSLSFFLLYVVYGSPFHIIRCCYCSHLCTSFFDPFENALFKPRVYRKQPLCLYQVRYAYIAPCTHGCGLVVNEVVENPEVQNSTETINTR